VIAWWGWLLIWTGLVLLLLATLAFFVWRLVKRFFVLLDDADTLLQKTSMLDDAVAIDDRRPLNAVLEESAAVRARFAARMERRSNRRHARRKARIERAKMITTADIEMKEWPS
jgi:hypothetical protein